MQISFSRHLIQLSINPASSTRGFHGICRKSFFTSSSHSFQSDCIRLTNFRIFAFVDDKSGNAIFATGCYPVGVVVWRRGEAPFSKSTVRGLCGGKIFPHTPIFYARVAGTGSCGSSLPGRGGGSAALLVRLRRPTLHRASRCGRGPSLRCVHLRRTCSLLLCFRKGSSFTSAPRRIPRLLCRAEASRGIHFHGQLSGLLRYMVGVLGFEPRTSSLSGTRSNQLSYTPFCPKKLLAFRPRASGPRFAGPLLFGGPGWALATLRVPIPALRHSVRLRRTRACE